MAEQANSTTQVAANSVARRAAWFRRIWAALAIALFAATWRLWTPQATYPQVPLLPIGRIAPLWLDWVGLTGIGLSLITALFAGGEWQLGKAALWLFATSAAGMFVLDQHRLQPWAFQFMLIAVVLATRRPERGLMLLRVLAVGVYFWSALGKFDHTFLHGVGQQFLATVVGRFGLSLETWPQTWRLVAAGIFPTGEMLVALGLCFRRTRLVAVIGAIVMHMGLLSVLGPWGLNHQPGVLLWNVFFLAQAVLLFLPLRRRRPTEEAKEITEPAADHSRWGFAEVLIGLAVALPALEGWGWWDHWPSWGLYSTRAEGATVLVHRLAVIRLPDKLQTYLRPVTAGKDWRELEIDRWSLETLHAPIYPQARFQLGVAEAVGRQYELGGLIQAVHYHAADRWTGARRRNTYLGVEALATAISKLRLNGHPRRHSGSANRATPPT